METLPYTARSATHAGESGAGEDQIWKVQRTDWECLNDSRSGGI